MNDNQSRRSGRRPSRGGSRRGPRGPRDDNDRGEGRASQSPSNNSTSGSGFWQKVKSLFGFGQKEKAYPAYEPRTQHPAYEGSNATNREPAQPARPARESRPEPRTARKPEAIDVTSPKLYVGNLSFDAVESDLSELFNGVGQVQNAEIVAHRETQKSKGFGFVTMTTVDEAKRAVEELHDKDFMGRKLVVSGAKTPVDRAA